MPQLSSTLYSYRLPLRFPLAVRGAAGNERQGLLLRLRAQDGAVGWGDAAPLPGWSNETLHQAAADLRRLAAHIPPGRPDAQWILGRQYVQEDSCPSARFAFESAYLGLLAAQAGLGLRNILTEAAADRIDINALITGDPDNDFEGYRTFKLKVGRQPLEDEIAWVHRVSDRLPDNARLRLDANRAWSAAEAVRFAAAVADCPIEYLEEPLRDAGQLAEFTRQSPVPTAVDETLKEQGAAFLDTCPGLRAAVLKPALNGGLIDALHIAEAARRHGLYVVVSSGFESGVGIRALAQLAGAIVAPGVACGLDPYRWIKEDVIEPELEMEGGSLDLAQLDRTIAIVRMDALQELQND